MRAAVRLKISGGWKPPVAQSVSRSSTLWYFVHHLVLLFRRVGTGLDCFFVHRWTQICFHRWTQICFHRCTQICFHRWTQICFHRWTQICFHRCTQIYLRLFWRFYLCLSVKSICVNLPHRRDRCGYYLCGNELPGIEDLAVVEDVFGWF